ncbi:MAG: hypothetical protein OT477_12125 [Chloroflexi bacterium]|nr:hypothetical protein [Chloroflexota bacterium]
MTHRFNPQAFEPLDEEEQLLMETIEEDGWEAVANLEEEKIRLIEVARLRAKPNSPPTRCIMTTLEKLEQLTHYIQMKNGQ